MRHLDRAKIEMGAIVYAYCLMGNHFHLAVKVSGATLSSIMQRILTGYASVFNERHDRSGHLFQARYKAVLCLDDRYLLGLIRYIQMNPVRAGLVDRPEDWPWSSRSPEAIPDQDGASFDPWPQDANKPILARSAAPETVDLNSIGARLFKATGISLEALRTTSKSRCIVNARILATSEAVKSGYSLSSIAAWLNTSVSTVSYYLRKNSTNLKA